MARRATIISQLRTKNPNTLLFEAGNWAETANPAYNQQVTDYIFKVMQQLRYDAVTLGIEELRYGVRHYEDLSRGAPAILISNVREVVKGQRLPVGREWIIRDVGGVRIGAFGLVGLHKTSTEQNKQVDYVIEDSVENAGRIVSRLKTEGCEVIVLLAQMAPSFISKVIHSVADIDVAILGFRPGLRKNPSKAGNTIIVRNGFRGQYFGQLELVVDPDGEIAAFSGVSIPVSKTLEMEPSIRKLNIEMRKKITSLQKKEAPVGRVREKMH